MVRKSAGASIIQDVKTHRKGLEDCIARVKESNLSPRDLTIIRREFFELFSKSSNHIFASDTLLEFDDVVPNAKKRKKG